ncbi:MAG: SMC-Scp complex subunit ScpB [Elusimicrobia bacterium]|nr:SMC-Scp complex subunit ScpB [Elusimicrobiota bacterium]
MEELEIKKVVETLLFIADQPIPVERIAQICNLKENKIQKALEALQEDYGARTFQIMNVAGGYQMATRQEYSLWIRRLYHDRMTVRLSTAALETLSIIAYKQPITRAEVESIRGVEVIGPLETLLERRLITTVGRKETVGRPLLYGTTKEFLRQFGLNSLDNLPDINTLIDQESSAFVRQAIAASRAPAVAKEAIADTPAAENENQKNISSNDVGEDKMSEESEKVREKESDISDDEIVPKTQDDKRNAGEKEEER